MSHSQRPELEQHMASFRVSVSWQGKGDLNRRCCLITHC